MGVEAEVDTEVAVAEAVEEGVAAEEEAGQVRTMLPWVVAAGRQPTPMSQDTLCSWP